MIKFAAWAILATVFLLASCQGPEAGADSRPTSGTTSNSVGAALNMECPISAEPVSAAETVSHNGQTVAFCCASCRGKWDAWSEEEKAAFIADATGH